MEVEALMRLVDVDTVEVVGGARMRGGRLCFLSLPLSRPDPGLYPAISDLYNI